MEKQVVEASCAPTSGEAPVPLEEEKKSTETNVPGQFEEVPEKNTAHTKEEEEEFERRKQKKIDVFKTQYKALTALRLKKEDH